MEIIKDTPFEVATVTWQLSPPAWSLTVVVKGTFSLADDGSLSVAETQRPCEGDILWDDVEPGSPRRESDLAVYKPRGEWFVEGHCYPPGGEATTSACSVTLGRSGRALAVFGDRHWGAAGVASAPAPFTAMPLRWERAYGGPGHPSNPVGRGVEAVETREGRVHRLPNLEAPEARVESPHRPGFAACFAPVGRTWPVRSAFAGTYDATWRATRFPWFAADLDTAYFLGSQHLQWAETYWRGDEPFELVNLHPQHPRLRGQLAAMTARVLATPAGLAPNETNARALNAVLDTVTFLPDEMAVTCVWRAVLTVTDETASNLGFLYVTHDDLEAPRPLAALVARLAAERDAQAAEAGADAEVPPPGAPLSDAERMFSPAVAGLAGTLAARGISAFDATLRTHDAAPAPSPPQVDHAALRGRLMARLANDEAVDDLDLSDADLRGLDLAGRSLKGLLAPRAQLSGATLDRCDLSDAVLTDASLAHAALRGATLTRAELSGCSAEAASFDRAVLREAVFEAATLSRASFANAIVDGCDFTRAALSGAVLREASGKAVEFTAARLDGVQAERAVLPDATFRRASVVGARFDDARLDNLRALDGAVFDTTSFRGAKLDGANFSESRLVGSHFAFASLKKAEFSDATLTRAGFEGCVLKGACFDRADLREAAMLRCDLHEARFEASDLRGADLRGSNLYGAELWRAQTEGLRTELAIVTRSGLDPNL